MKEKEILGVLEKLREQGIFRSANKLYAIVTNEGVIIADTELPSFKQGSKLVKCIDISNTKLKQTAGGNNVKIKC